MTAKDILKLEQKVLPWDAHRVREDFPILHREMNGLPLVYLDNAATTQKPMCVIDRLLQYYTHENANVHRGVYAMAEEATAQFEEVRKTVKSFIHAHDKNEIVFTKGATEAINLVASTYGRTHLKKGDEIILSGLEHHANIVPWQMLAKEIGFHIHFIPLLENGDLDLGVYRDLISRKTKFVGVTHVSNAVGTINPVKEMVYIAHQCGAKVLVDACQSVVHMPINVQEMDCDFLVFSSHKVYGPTGVGVLYGKAALLAEMPPYQGGGDMITRVTFESSEYAAPPLRFEAGTPNIADVIAFGAALEYLKAFSFDAIISYEQELLEYALQGLQEIPGIAIVGGGHVQAPIVSFVLAQIHPHDVATIISQSGIAARAGHHCAMPTLQALGVPATTRISMSYYNTFAELDLLFNALYLAKKVFL
jgi:cysteine desulfurase/selenocysteine lyase